jgi:hypothetical protein
MYIQSKSFNIHSLKLANLITKLTIINPVNL